MVDATVNLFVDWGAEFHNPPWQVNNGVEIVPGKTTAFQLLQLAAVVPPLTVGSEGSGAGVFVTAIDGVVEDQNGNQYWWVYSVNNSEPSVGANAYILQGGESVAWDYKHVSSGFKQASHPGLKR